MKMSNDTKWIIGIVGGGVTTVIGAAIAVMGFLISGIETQIENVNSNLTTQMTEVHRRIDDIKDSLEKQIEGVKDSLEKQIDGVQIQINEINTTVRGMDERLRAVENNLGQVDQRLETLMRQPPETVRSGENTPNERQEDAEENPAGNDPVTLPGQNNNPDA